MEIADVAVFPKRSLNHHPGCGFAKKGAIY
jgi:hypothetical protein